MPVLLRMRYKLVAISMSGLLFIPSAYVTVGCLLMLSCANCSSGPALAGSWTRSQWAPCNPCNSVMLCNPLSCTLTWVFSQICVAVYLFIFLKKRCASCIVLHCCLRSEQQEEVLLSSVPYSYCYMGEFLNGIVGELSSLFVWFSKGDISHWWETNSSLLTLLLWLLWPLPETSLVHTWRLEHL